MNDCERFLGAPFEEVNRWLDEFMPKVGAGHRRFRHHREGVKEAAKLFGDAGARAAIVHILRDCRNIPAAEDYETGAADNLGLKAGWPASAYVHYPEEALALLVKYTLEGPMAVLLWIFFRSEADLAGLLLGISRWTREQQKEQLQNWSQAQARFDELNQTPLQPAQHKDPEGDIADVCADFSAKFPVILDHIPGGRFAMVRTEDLITPLTMIDYEYVEELKAALTGTESADIARFALPAEIEMQVKTAIDPSVRAINIISSQKSLTLHPVTVNQIPGVGLEVKFLLSGFPQMILVSRVEGRYYLRNGIHRAYLLASLGVKEIPCILADEKQIPATVGAYPSFAPHILALPRPPLLRDTLDPTMYLLMPLVRTHKVIRISAEELILPTS
jgi:hypothetical protein